MSSRSPDASKVRYDTQYMLPWWNTVHQNNGAKPSEEAHTFHAVKDLPSDLYGSDDCGKTLVKKNDILKANHAVRKSRF